MTSIGSDPQRGPVLFAYDGTELAGFAIEQAAAQLATPRDAVVVCVWQPADVGFTPVTERHFDADQAGEVQKAAEETAAQGVMLAEKSGFRARSSTAKSAPTWKGIVQAAEDEGASLIVIGTHRHGGLVGHLVGNVASAVVAHSPVSVLVVHQPV
jgi:nucleotide-binding universal stress UspA family protein